jgi:hypothetical protein
VVREVDMVVADEDTREMRLASWIFVRNAYLFSLSHYATHLSSLLCSCYMYAFVRVEDLSGPLVDDFLTKGHL